MTLYFATELRSGREATRTEIASVRERLASSARIRTYAFVSKRLALRRLGKQQPELVQGLPGNRNPLPNAYEIVPRSRDDARRLVAELRPVRGIEHVSSAKSC